MPRVERRTPDAPGQGRFKGRGWPREPTRRRRAFAVSWRMTHMIVAASTPGRARWAMLASLIDQRFPATWVEIKVTRRSEHDGWAAAEPSGRPQYPETIGLRVAE